jgi:cytochrome P450
MHVMQTLALAPMTALLPFRLPGLPYRRLYDVAEQMERDLRALVEHKRTQTAAHRDVLALMIAAHDEDGSQFSDVELISILHALFGAAFDTSSSTVATTLLLLSLHPEQLAEVVAELDEVLGDQPVSPAVLARLECLDRAIKESARVLPAVPILFFRELSRAAQLGPHTLPRGAKLVLSPFATHRDATLYPEPARFRPERWKTLDPTPYQYMPFGAGPRTCIGMSFANMSVRLVLASILQRYQPSVAPNANISRAFRGLIFDFAHGLPMILTPRPAAPPTRGPLRGDITQIVDLS